MKRVRVTRDGRSEDVAVSDHATALVVAPGTTVTAIPKVRRVNGTPRFPRFIRRYPVTEAMRWRTTDDGRITRRDRKYRAKVRRWFTRGRGL